MFSSTVTVLCFQTDGLILVSEIKMLFGLFSNKKVFEREHRNIDDTQHVHVREARSMGAADAAAAHGTGGFRPLRFSTQKYRTGILTSMEWSWGGGGRFRNRV